MNTQLYDPEIPEFDFDRGYAQGVQDALDVNKFIGDTDGGLRVVSTEAIAFNRGVLLGLRVGRGDRPRK